MYQNDLLLAFVFMAGLFLRQILILKRPNKLNYGPLMLGIGAISSLVHFIVYPEVSDGILLLRESLFPFLVSLFLYIVMNVLHQNQQVENRITQDEFTLSLIDQITQLKTFVADLETRMIKFSQEDRAAQEEVQVKFKNDLQALDAIKINQGKFLTKFDELEGWHKNVSKEFENFTNVQMPELDNVVHKHIDILRVAEQDHYNQLKKTLEKAVESRGGMSREIEELKKNLLSMKSLSDEIAKSITKHTLQQLSDVTKAFENQIISLNAHAESVKTSLYEGENRLSGIRTQSELIMSQMVLSSKKMSELQEKNSGLNDLYGTIKDLMVDIEIIKADYVKSQAQLSIIAGEIKLSENESIENMKMQVDSLSDVLTKKIEDSLEKLHEHYHIAGDDITQSVQILSQKAKLQSRYTELDKEKLS